MLHLSCKFGEPKWNPYWAIVLRSWSGINYVPNEQGSDQFMNWIGIDNQFNSIQHELNWNWIERFWIGIELELKAWTDRNWSIQSIHFQLNSPFYKVKHFFVCHTMEIVVQQAIPCKQAYPHTSLCIPSRDANHYSFCLIITHFDASNVHFCLI